MSTTQRPDRRYSMTVIGRTTPKAPEPEVIKQPNEPKVIEQQNEAEVKPKKPKKDDAK